MASKQIAKVKDKNASSGDRNEYFNKKKKICSHIAWTVN